MKFTFKSLSGDAFQMDCDDASTVGDVKQKIAIEKGDDKFPKDLQRWIYNGKVRENDSKMGDLKFEEGKFIVVMVSKQKPAVPLSPIAPPAPFEIDASPTSTNTTADTAPSVATPSDTTSGTATSQQGTSDLVTQLVSMGYPRDESIHALNAANNDLNVAVEFLVNGIPEMGVVNPELNTMQNAQLNMGPQQQNDLDFLRNNPQFQAARQMIQANPSLLPMLLQQIASVNPQAAANIAANPNAFLALLNGSGARSMNNLESEPTQPSGQPNVVNQQQQIVAISETDREAIERIKALGFSEAQAVEAYLACEKNEMLAANFLFNQIDNEDQQQHGN